MVNLLKKNLFLIILIVVSLIFFNKTIISGLLPIPADNIVGLYYPFRDNYLKTNPNGLPYKNFLITDPVRQTYPWKNLVINSFKKLELPLWNPYNFSGTPLFANFQSGTFYPLNILFFVFPFSLGWTILIVTQTILAGIFMYLYLSNLKLRRESSLFGAVVFSFCGFFIAWLEWGNIVNTALWLPLILLSIDKILSSKEFLVKNKYFLVWNIIFLISLISSFFAGHLQTFFYIFVLSIIYILFRISEQKNKIKSVGLFVIPYVLFLILTAIQWYPTFQFILLSARDADLTSYNASGWFIPWQNIIQFIAPDFFGNTSTLNYFGEWNYGEFVGYIGILPLILAAFAILFRRTREALFFGIIFIFVLIFAFPNPVSKIPFIFNLPFISTAQPTRLIFIADFALSVLAAFGLEEYLRKSKRIVYILPFFVLILILLWGFVLGKGFGLESAENLLISKQNLKLPSILIISSIILLLIPLLKFVQKNKKIEYAVIILIITVSIFDLFRFGWKFEPFSKSQYLYPSTKVTSYIQNQPGIFRVMSTDAQIFPPNFSIMYGIQVPDGYDPLYLRRYGELMAAYGRNKPDISAPFGFNRIITMQNPDSRIVDLLGIRYVLSFNDPMVSKLTKVYSDGKVHIYQNNNSFPRVFFVPSTIFANTKQEAMNALFDVNYPLTNRAVVEGVKPTNFKSNWDMGEIKINSYESNSVKITTKSVGDGFLVFTDAYYPTWKATIDGKETTIFITDYTFRGIIVPKGSHVIEFTNNLF